MPEWLKGTGCKPVGSAYVGSNPIAPIERRSTSHQSESELAPLLAAGATAHQPATGLGESRRVASGREPGGFPEASSSIRVFPRPSQRFSDRLARHAYQGGVEAGFADFVTHLCAIVSVRLRTLRSPPMEGSTCSTRTTTRNFATTPASTTCDVCAQTMACSAVSLVRSASANSASDHARLACHVAQIEGGLRKTSPCGWLGRVASA